MSKKVSRPVRRILARPIHRANSMQQIGTALTKHYDHNIAVKNITNIVVCYDKIASI